jgi:CheY-like chemotaxis protein
MTVRILVVDDEPDVEALILQRFRHKIRDEAVSFLFARDGVEALATLKANGNIDLGSPTSTCRGWMGYRYCRSCRRVSQMYLPSSCRLASRTTIRNVFLRKTI